MLEGRWEEEGEEEQEEEGEEEVKEGQKEEEEELWKQESSWPATVRDYGSMNHLPVLLTSSPLSHTLIDLRVKVNDLAH